MRQNARAICVALLILLAFAAGVRGETLRIELPQMWSDAAHLALRTISTSGDRIPLGRIVLPGFGTCGPSGSPALPCKLLYIALPPDADPATVKLAPQSQATTLLPGSYDVAPVPPIAPADQASTVEPTARDSRVYGRNAFYPSQHLRVREVGLMRRWNVAVVEYWPYCCNPATGALRLLAVRDITLEYQTKRAGAGSGDLTPPPLAELVVNADEAKTWYGATEAQAPGYAIITTKAILHGSRLLEDFAELQTVRGFQVIIATEDDWGGGIGNAAADNIRRWLSYYYERLRLKYALLIGNPHPANGDVPMKMLWPRYSQSSYREAPSDLYYADLSGSWDRDCDGICGEEPDDLGPGGIDRMPEVLVGRIPVYGNLRDLDRILAKTISYETSELGHWSHRCLLATRTLDAYTPGYHLGERIRRNVAEPAGITAVRAYDGLYGLEPPPEYSPCSYDAVQNAWREGVGLVLWMTHGSATDAGGVMRAEQCPLLDDSRPAIVYQASCSNGLPEDPGNLAYSLLLNGAVSTVASTRAAWYYVGETDFTCSDSVGGLGYGYVKNLISNGASTALALADARLAPPMYIWPNQLVMNLLGDPSLVFGRPAPGAVWGTVRTIAGRPVEGARVASADGVAWTLSGPDGTYLLQRLAAGAHDITVSAAAFHPQRFHEIAVAAGRRTRLDCQLVGAATGSITGRVTDAYGSPIPDAVITLGDGIETTTSLPDGTYLFSAVPPGVHRLLVDRPPYAQKAVPECMVFEGQLAVVNVFLEPRVGNAVRNGSFEQVADDGSALYWRGFATPNCPNLVTVGNEARRYGMASQKVVLSSSDGDTSAGVCQTVSVAPGRPYSLVAWQRGHCDDADSKANGYARCRIGYDPTGGDDIHAPTVVWHEFEPMLDVWHNVFAEVVPYSPTITIFLEARRKHQTGPGDYTAWFDGVSLRGPALAPPVPNVRVSSRYQSDKSSIRAEWSCADPSVTSYEYAVSSTCDESGIIAGGRWESVGEAAGATRTGLSLMPGDLLRVLVRSRNVFGVVSEIGVSDPVRIVADTPSAVRATPDRSWVRIQGLRVSRMGQGPECFVQDPQRVAGLKVTSDWSRMPYLQPGTTVTVVGMLTTEGSLRVLCDAEVMPSLVAEPPRPLALLSRYVGGARPGLDNSGLLVAVAGRVVSADSEWFTIDDGSLRQGLRVDCHNSATPPPVGSFVRVVGIATPSGLAAYDHEDITLLADDR